MFQLATSCSCTRHQRAAGRYWFRCRLCMDVCITAYRQTSMICASIQRLPTDRPTLYRYYVPRRGYCCCASFHAPRAKPYYSVVKPSANMKLVAAPERYSVHKCRPIGGRTNHFSSASLLSLSKHQQHAASSVPSTKQDVGRITAVVRVVRRRQIKRGASSAMIDLLLLPTDAIHTSLTIFG